MEWTNGLIRSISNFLRCVSGTRAIALIARGSNQPGFSRAALVVSLDLTCPNFKRAFLGLVCCGRPPAGGFDDCPNVHIDRLLINLFCLRDWIPKVASESNAYILTPQEKQLSLIESKFKYIAFKLN